MNYLLKSVSLVLLLLLVAPIYAKSNNTGDVVKKESLNAVLVERNGIQSIVSEEEFSKASDYEKKIITMIDATINALSILDDDNKIAIISISKNDRDNFSNSILIANKEPNNPETLIENGTCKVCGMGSAMRCLAELQKIDSNSFDVHVDRIGDGCVRLRW